MLEESKQKLLSNAQFLTRIIIAECAILIYLCDRYHISDCFCVHWTYIQHARKAALCDWNKRIV